MPRSGCGTSTRSAKQHPLTLELGELDVGRSSLEQADSATSEPLPLTVGQTESPQLVIMKSPVGAAGVRGKGDCTG